MAKTLNDRLLEGQDIVRAIKNTYKSYKSKITRYNKRLEIMLIQPYLYFMTFTLTNEFINLEHKTIERKIKEALKSASHYIVNQDYGKEFGRLHYHALVSYDIQLNYNTLYDIYKYGAINYQPVKIRNQKAIREYLLGHQEKQTAGRSFMSRIKLTENEIKIKLKHKEIKQLDKINRQLLLRYKITQLDSIIDEIDINNDFIIQKQKEILQLQQGD